ncbi:CoA-acylating methylmalonate-semialdehyde dehydrogenase [Gallibacterium anatis]|uniref:methylmalonate-semialdehyde dehydrogenase (CoA acylating) n=2 Tax=Gallibacterium anatis TaxID=750 RepID=U1I7I4_9PAST|nr:CoA-acylating methylmalonate-semialdehyde dehydrogenase [Gallibacterium anatis]ERF79375.1 methylmalonate-semialdehyde dehydrogenase [Gallibacterium anatis 12656/12]KGQ42532.1 methylmalonate-semialdehyde dehydrogenase [Gallibacterium anatis IPDH697-78]KGQ49172.1 methylmalonate-semialdehyde dehydrogenase [Gallibacterium anatis]KGQ52035.1 methylmalonate-semialdehyde dehydrogenase [Gallibacterium anatis 10672-6]KGQ62747.1 methylmalonate-semialdehyde dehydrogenase [Gallibacterium anatis 4895]
MNSIIPNFINGQPIESESQRISFVYNPATGEQTKQVKLSTTAEMENAISAAQDAFPAWSQLSPLRRARILFKFKTLLEENFDELARLISNEHGKIYSDSIGELTRGLEVVEFATGIPHLLKGEFSANVGRGIDSFSMMQPLGVVAGITPFNFPAMVPMWMFPIALACGNTFVLKPSEKDPSLSIRLAELLKEAGLPDGVFNVVQGDKEVVDVLLKDPRIQAVSFVGSTPIAQYIYETGSKYGKRVQALGGAKNHALIMPDADIETTANALLGAAFGAAGERCMALSVAVTIDNDYADALIQNLVPKIKGLHIGPGVLPEGEQENDMGPLISKAHLEKVSGYIDQGVSEGAKLVVDGRNYKVKGYENGYFIGGSLFDNVTPEMTIYKEEIFGPVLAIVRAKNYQEAIQLINEHQYGNGSAIFTSDGDAARQYSHDVKAGMVGINIPIPVPMAFHCFGGWKASIFGPLNAYGPDGVRFYTRMKTVTSRWPNHKVREQGAAFSMPTL